MIKQLPTGAIARLRSPGMSRFAGGVCVSASDLNEVLAYLADYAPSDLPNSTAEILTGAFREISLTVEEEFSRPDIVRVNGAVYVPETIEIEEDASFDCQPGGLDIAASSI